LQFTPKTFIFKINKNSILYFLKPLMAPKKTEKKLSKSSKISQKNKRGRPPKNVVGGRSTKPKGRGRPPKNIIQPRKSKTIKKPKTITQKTIKKSPKTPKSKTKNLTKFWNKTKTTQKSNSKPSKIKKNKRPFSLGFSHHKVSDPTKKTNNFALRLLVFSFLLFAFSIYKAFYEPKINTQNTTITTSEITPTTNPLSSQRIVIEAYNPDNKKIITNTGTNTKEKIPKETKEINKTYPLPKFEFTRAFNKNEEHKNIEILQKLLSNEGIYTGPVNGKYDITTIDAVYTFQTKYNIIQTNTPRTAYGHLGPSTRNQINQLMP